MTKRSTKSALLSAVLALVICFTALLGTTFAWFTDSVTSANNKIVAGNLDVDLYLWGANGSTEITENSEPLFGSKTGLAQDNAADTLWEPGKTQVVYLSIKNNGSLDLKYRVALEVRNPADSKDLYKVLTYDIVEDAQFGSVDAWSGNGVAVELGTNATQAVDVALKAGAEHFFALAIHMDEEAGNEYQFGSVEFDVKVLATQLTSEVDSFDNQYDANATYPQTSNAVVSGEDAEIQAGNITVTIPEEAGDGTYVLKVDNYKEETDAATNATTLSMNIDLLKDGVKVSSNGISYPVSIDVGTGRALTKVTHNGEPVTNYTYDCYGTGILSFEVTSFSPFTVEMLAPADENAQIVYIYNLDDFTAFGKAVNGDTTYGGFAVANNDNVRVELMADIDMTNAPAIQGTEFAIGNGNNLLFTGTFDGNGHTISNYHIEGSWTYNVSLFRTVSGKFTMIDVTFDNCSASKPNNRNSSLIVGTIGGGTITFENVTIKNTTINGVAGSSAYAGKMTEGALYFRNCKAENVTLNATSATAQNGMFLYDGYSHHDYEASGVWVEDCTITNSHSFINGVEESEIAAYNYVK